MVFGERWQHRLNPVGINDCVYVSEVGKCHHSDRKCHGLRNTSRVNERRICQICGWSEVSNHSAENRRIASRSQLGGAAT